VKFKRLTVAGCNVASFFRESGRHPQVTADWLAQLSAVTTSSATQQKIIIGIIEIPHQNMKTMFFNILKFLLQGLKLKKKFLEVPTIMTGIKQTNSCQMAVKKSYN